ncbi:MAG: hypothetical protein KKB20_12455 [Proteobacteria bacterium]|nr:hypothetical protein [Pseudomonadota bacterium]
MTETGEKKLTTERLTNMAFAFKQSGALLGAIELDLFSKCGTGGSTTEELAEEMGLSLTSTDKLVTACAALGLLIRRDGRCFNALDTDRYLVRGRPKYYGDYLLYQARSEYDVWKDLTPALRKPVLPSGMYHQMMSDPEIARGITVAGYNSSIAAGRKLTREFDFSPYRLFLDLGGGSGCYSIPACESNPGLEAVVFDFPNVIQVTREFIEQAGLTDRISTRPGDFTRDDLPQGADLVGVIGNLHAYAPDETARVVDRAFQAVSPGGGLLIIDYMLNEDKTGPLEPALRHLESAAYSSRGWVKTGAEVESYMRQAGAVDTMVTDFIPGSLTRVFGRRPA